MLNRNKVVMSKEETHILIDFEDGKYLQRLEPITTSERPLTTEERLILFLQQKIDQLEREVDKLKSDKYDKLIHERFKEFISLNKNLEKENKELKERKTNLDGLDILMQKWNAIPNDWRHFYDELKELIETKN